MMTLLCLSMAALLISLQLMVATPRLTRLCRRYDIREAGSGMVPRHKSIRENTCLNTTLLVVRMMESGRKKPRVKRNML